MSKTIVYKGLSQVRQITASDWASLGITETTKRWEQSNSYEQVLNDTAASWCLAQPSDFIDEAGLTFPEVVGEGPVRALVVSQAIGQQDKTTKLNALRELANTTGKWPQILLPADSHSQPWYAYSGGQFYSWFQQIVRKLRQFMPITDDVILCTRPVDVSRWTTNCATLATQQAAAQHGLGGQGITLVAGEYWQFSLGGETDQPLADGFEIFLTMQAAGGASIQVLLDGAPVKAATTTTGGAAPYGHTQFYKGPVATDGAVHQVRVVCSGAGTAKVDLGLAHHGTYLGGAIAWNASLNGSNQATHLAKPGYKDAVRSIGNNLLMTVIANGLTSWDDAGETGNTYVADITSAVTMIRDVAQGNSTCDIALAHECEPAGFGGVLATGGNLWTNWRAVTTPKAKLLAESLNMSYIGWAGPMGSASGKAVNDNGIDVWTWAANINGVPRDYVHGNRIFHDIMAKVAWDALFGVGMTAKAPLGPLDVGTPAFVTAALKSVDKLGVVFDGGNATFSNSTVKTSMLSTPLVIPANVLQNGDSFELEWHASIVNFVAATQLVLIELTLGGVVFFSRGITAAASAGYTVYGRSKFGVVTAGAVSEIHASTLVPKDIGGSHTARLNDPSGQALMVSASNAVGAPLTPNTTAAISIDIQGQMPIASGLLGFQLGYAALTRKPKFV